MKRTVMMSIALVLGVIMLQSCGENKNTDLVESGTYTGVAEDVEPGERKYMSGRRIINCLSSTLPIKPSYQKMEVKFLLICFLKAPK